MRSIITVLWKPTNLRNSSNKSNACIHSQPVCVHPLRRTDRGAHRSPIDRLLLAPLFFLLPISVDRPIAVLLKLLIEIQCDGDDDDNNNNRNDDDHDDVNNNNVDPIDFVEVLVRRSVDWSTIFQSIFQLVGRSLGLPFSESVRMFDQSVGRRSKSLRKGRKNVREGAGMEGKERAGREDRRMKRGA